jgi:hypothetical protein
VDTRAANQKGVSQPDAVKRLQQSMYDGGETAFSVVPIGLARVIRERLWEQCTDKQGAPFQSFEAFAAHKLWWGLESSIDDLLAYCRKTPDVQALIRREIGAVEEQPRDERGHFTRSDNIRTDYGTAATYTLRRLKRDRPDLAERVIVGELTAHAAAIEAGFRRRTISVPLDVESAARALRRHFRSEEISRLVERLAPEQGLVSHAADFIQGKGG